MPQRQRTTPVLGDRLRDQREARGWSLREVAARAGMNHGYLSQLERGEVAEPAPSMLHRVAAAYEVPFTVVMQWAGYIEEGGPLTANQEMALQYLGEDVTEEELEAIRAVIDVIRARRATMDTEAERLDGPLSPEDRKAIRAQVLMLLRHAGAVDVFPTPLDRVVEVSKLVSAGEITLADEEKRDLRRRFGSLVDGVLQRLQGVLHRKAREIWVQPDLPEMRRRFVIAHEIGHDVLPWQKELAYLDDDRRLREDVRIRYEREANQAAIELLAQGDALRREADDSPLTMTTISDLSAKYAISLQATARRITEETRKEAAMAIRFRGRSGAIGPYHVYCSSSFQARFGWALSPLPVEARNAVRTARAAPEESAEFSTSDRAMTFVELKVETIVTPYALIAVFSPVPVARSMRRRFLRVS